MEINLSNMSEEGLGFSITPTAYVTVFMGDDNKELLKLCANGDIFVRGELTENNQEVVEAFKNFLQQQNFLK